MNRTDMIQGRVTIPNEESFNLVVKKLNLGGWTHKKPQIKIEYPTIVIPYGHFEHLDNIFFESIKKYGVDVKLIRTYMAVNHPRGVVVYTMYKESRPLSEALDILPQLIAFDYKLVDFAQQKGIIIPLQEPLTAGLIREFHKYYEDDAHLPSVNEMEPHNIISREAV